MQLLGAILLTACASAPPRAPPPFSSDAAAIVIEVELRLPIQEWRDSANASATVVYFARACPDPSPPCTEKIVPSNYDSDGRVYLLNVEPGDYKPVAAAYETSYYYGIGSSRGVSIAYLPDALAREASVQVRAGRLSVAGRHLVTATFGVCPDSADPGQLRYAEMLDPGTQKCGMVETVVDAMLHVHRTMKPEVVIGGKAYPTGTSAQHFRGVSHQLLPEEPGANVFATASKDLAASGWHFVDR